MEGYFIVIVLQIFWDFHVYPFNGSRVLYSNLQRELFHLSRLTVLTIFGKIFKHPKFGGEQTGKLLSLVSVEKTRGKRTSRAMFRATALRRELVLAKCYYSLPTYRDSTSQFVDKQLVKKGSGIKLK